MKLHGVRCGVLQAQRGWESGRTTGLLLVFGVREEATQVGRARATSRLVDLLDRRAVVAAGARGTSTAGHVGHTTGRTASSAVRTHHDGCERRKSESVYQVVGGRD